MSGVVALEKLQALKPLCGEILLINANPSAQKQNKRYIERDLNRCFGQKKL
jgi:succinylglutamate desuccinylase